MTRLLIRMLSICALLALGAAAQAQDDYLDLYIAKVKPEKRAEFDAISKKIADANRRFKGDHWVTYQVEYGEQNTVYFVGPRKNFAGIEEGFNVFEKALKESFGPAGMKLLQDSNNCVISSRGEIRRRRWDLSRHASSDPADLARMIGEARWLRTTSVLVRQGHAEAFEASIRMVNQAAQKSSSKSPVLVSQSLVGVPGRRYYFTSLQSSIAGFDNVPSVCDILGAEGFSEYRKQLAEHTLSTEISLYRILPELSNPPEETVAVEPSFWRPKPAAAKPKPKTAEAPKAGA